MMALSETIPMRLVLETNGLEQDTYKAKLGRELSLKAHKQLPRPRDFGRVEDSFETHYDVPDNAIENGVGNDGLVASESSTNHVLPPTPPNAQDGDENAEELTSTPTTPPPQQSPPTPDITPPRRFVGAQPSMTSTRAESFRTAQEEFGSDDDTESLRRFRKSPASTLRSRLSQSRAGHRAMSSSSLIADPYKQVSFDAVNGSTNLSSGAPLDTRQISETVHQNSVEDGQHHVEFLSLDSNGDSPSLETSLPRRGMSLRDRLKAQQINSPSTDHFGDSIGWPNGERPIRESKRASDTLLPSKVEAMVYETPTPPRRQQTLRHSRKNDSLRSASSPIPARSDRNSLVSNPESSPTLHRKKARLSNQNRWSYGSEVSRSFSMASSGVLPRTETEIIKVAVIPERGSSLRSSANSSRRHSVALSHSSGDDYYPPNSYHSRERGSDLSYRRRSASDSSSPVANRGRLPDDNVVIPPRKSSLSAPTSLSNSRTSSLTSRSDHHRTRRIAAEKDLRKTLDRMESERLMPKLQILTSTEQQNPEVNPTPSTIQPLSGTWESLRPPSVLNTPFSQPSAVSASPGPVEMGEARTVNYFPHNNRSLQLIEKHPLPESVASRKARQLIANEPLTPSTTYDSNRNSQSLPVGQAASTPSTTRRSLTVDSPLRNPRQPPEPPNFKVVPPSPAAATQDDEQIRQPAPVSLARSPRHKRHASESFVKSLTRNFSLKNAQNRKAEQDLDGQLHPFWRPRGFWDGLNESDDEGEPRERSLVKNSVGIPQERTVISGPVSLIRSISDGSRRWRNRGLASKPSDSSLSKLHASRKMYRIPRLGAHFHFVGLHDLQERLLLAKARKEDEQREKRRADLRKSIGANVISQGDSRFPVSSLNPSFTLTHAR